MLGASHHRTPDDHTAEIVAVIERYRAGFAAVDPDALISIWDRHHEPVVYVAQELQQPIRGWAQIEA
jgi:hypothetical protein